MKKKKEIIAFDVDGVIFDSTEEWERVCLLYYFMKGKNFLRPAMKDAIAQQSVFGIIEATK